MALVACIRPVHGQFSNLATNDDGSVLYATSSLILDDMPADPLPRLRVFRLAPAVSVAVELAGSRQHPGISGSGDGADLAQVSGDGRTIGYTLRGVCDPDEQPCLQSQTVGEIRRDGQTIVLGQGSLRLSRNGRWALLDPQAYSFEEPAPAATLIDLATGQRIDAPAPSFHVLLPLASDGTVLVGDPESGQSPGLWRNGTFTPLQLGVENWPVALSDDARVLLYREVRRVPGLSGVDLRLRARNLESGRDTLLEPGGHDDFVTVLGLSNNGRVALYLMEGLRGNGPAFLADTETGVAVPLLLPPGERVSGGVLSGDGQTAFLVTTEGRIVRVRTVQGRPAEPETVVPATPSVQFRFGLVPGSLTRLWGTHLPRNAEELRGRIRFADHSAPILFVTADEVGIQIPWEAQQDQYSVPFTLDLPSASPFRQREVIKLYPVHPALEPAEAGVSSMFGAKFLKADFSGYVTELPKPGEIIHAYMTGLGPVEGPVRTGEPAPLDSPRPLREAFQCRFMPQSTPADTLFAGLAPGLIGVYQVTFRMPQEPTPPSLTGMACGGWGFYSFAGWPPPPEP